MLLKGHAVSSMKCCYDAAAFTQTNCLTIGARGQLGIGWIKQLKRFLTIKRKITPRLKIFKALKRNGFSGSFWLALVTGRMQAKKYYATNCRKHYAGTGRYCCQLALRTGLGVAEPAFMALAARI
jgi:hypothetical protein